VTKKKKTRAPALRGSAAGGVRSPPPVAREGYGGSAFDAFDVGVETFGFFSFFFSGVGGARTSSDRVANSTPMVDLDSRQNSFLVKRERRFDLPTPESPMRTTLNR
jgi:hypothetical protein